ncbi:MAG: hypothetical protein LQ340_005588 [Diploschistes diacapsis]|nr:MAG: hypothetical protein LQ340_005588 [Diploschistes diacapsis]
MVSFCSILLASAALLTAAFASPILSEPILAPRATTLCGEGSQGIKKPARNTTIQQQEDGTTFEVIYCSGQYFKTSSIDGSVWLHNPSSTKSGQLLVKDRTPDNKDAPAGFYSYRFNITIYPQDGDYLSGKQVLSVYETATGYYNPYNYAISELDLNFVAPASSK